MPDNTYSSSFLLQRPAPSYGFLPDLKNSAQLAFSDGLGSMLVDTSVAAYADAIDNTKYSLEEAIENGWNDIVPWSPDYSAAGYWYRVDRARQRQMREYQLQEANAAASFVGGMAGSFLDPGEMALNFFGPGFGMAGEVRSMTRFSARTASTLMLQGAASGVATAGVEIPFISMARDFLGSGPSDEELFMNFVTAPIGGAVLAPAAGWLQGVTNPAVTRRTTAQLTKMVAEEGPRAPAAQAWLELLKEPEIARMAIQDSEVRKILDKEGPLTEGEMRKLYPYILSPERFATIQRVNASEKVNAHVFASAVDESQGVDLPTGRAGKPMTFEELNTTSDIRGNQQLVIAALFKDLFGVDVRFHPNLTASGRVYPNHPGILFIKAGAYDRAKTLIPVSIHEFMHSLRLRDMKTYKKVVDFLALAQRDVRNSETIVQKAATAIQTLYADRWAQLSPDRQWDEVVAHSVSLLSEHPEFWRELYRKDRTVFDRFIQFFQSLMKKLRASQDPQMQEMARGVARILGTASKTLEKDPAWSYVETGSIVFQSLRNRFDAEAPDVQARALREFEELEEELYDWQINAEGISKESLKLENVYYPKKIIKDFRAWIRVMHHRFGKFSVIVAYNKNGNIFPQNHIGRALVYKVERYRDTGRVRATPVTTEKTPRDRDTEANTRHTLDKYGPGTEPTIEVDIHGEVFVSDPSGRTVDFYKPKKSREVVQENFHVPYKSNKEYVAEARKILIEEEQKRIVALKGQEFWDIYGDSVVREIMNRHPGEVVNKVVEEGYIGTYAEEQGWTWEPPDRGMTPEEYENHTIQQKTKADSEMVKHISSLRERLKNIYIGDSKNVDSALVQKIDALTDDQVIEVASYVKEAMDDPDYAPAPGEKGGYVEEGIEEANRNKRQLTEEEEMFGRMVDIYAEYAGKYFNIPVEDTYALDMPLEDKAKDFSSRLSSFLSRGYEFKGGAGDKARKWISSQASKLSTTASPQSVRRGLQTARPEIFNSAVELAAAEAAQKERGPLKPGEPTPLMEVLNKVPKEYQTLVLDLAYLEGVRNEYKSAEIVSNNSSFASIEDFKDLLKSFGETEATKDSMGNEYPATYKILKTLQFEDAQDGPGVVNLFREVNATAEINNISPMDAWAMVIDHNLDVQQTRKYLQHEAVNNLYRMVESGKERPSIEIQRSRFKTLMDALWRKDGFSGVTLPGRKSARQRLYLTPIFAVAAKYPGLWDDFISNKVSESIITYLASGKTTDLPEHFREFADTLSDIMDAQAAALNHLGGDIRGLSGYALKQVWYKTKGKNRAKFINDAIESFDWARMDRVRGRMDSQGHKVILFGNTENQMAYLNELFDWVSAEGWKEGLDPTIDTANFSKQVSYSRSVFLKPDKAFAWDKTYGSGNPAQSILNHINRRSDQIAGIEVFGPNPDTTFGLMENFFSNEGAKLSWDDRATFRQVMGMLDAPANDRLANVFRNIRQYENLVRLGKSGISSLMDIGTTASTMKFHGVDVGILGGKLLKEYISSALFSRVKKNRVELLELGAGLENLLGTFANRVTGEAGFSGNMSFANNLFFYINGLSLLTKAGQETTVKMFSEALGSGRIDPAAMARYGISEADLATIKEMAHTVPGIEGKHTLPSDLRAAGLDDLALRLESFYDQVMKESVIEPDPRSQAIARGGMKAGTWTGEIARETMRYTAFPMAMMNKTWRRIYASYGENFWRVFANPVSRQNIETMSFMASMLALGWFSVSLKDMASGAEPIGLDEMTGTNAMRILQASGIGGPFESFFSPQGFDMSEALMGPSVAAAVKTVQAPFDEDVTGASALMEWVPGQNLPIVSDMAKTMFANMFGDAIISLETTMFNKWNYKTQNNQEVIFDYRKD